MSEASRYGHLIRTLKMPYGEEEAIMAPRYNGSVANPPLFMDQSVHPGAKIWTEILHAYAPGGSFATPNQTMVRDSPHRHPDFDEYFHFFGSNPERVGCLGGEVEFWLGEGEEAEKFVLTQSCCIWVPAGTVHGPCVYRKVDNPLQPVILFVVCMAEVPEGEGAREYVSCPNDFLKTWH